MAFVNPELFKELCVENQPKLKNDMKSYPLDQENFEKWVNNHHPGTTARKVAERFRVASRHVSFTEFFTKYDDICNEINDHLSKNKYEQIVMYVNSDKKLKKSNFWLSLYIFPRLKLPFEKLFICTHFEVLDTLDFSKKTLIIVPDDASYSGTQMEQNLIVVSEFKFTDLDIMLAVGYVSEQARDRIKLRFPKSRLLICDATEYFPIFRIDENEEDELSEKRNLYTIYFDHKLPDMVSIYQVHYGIGLGFGEEKDFNYVPMSLIKGCETYKYISENPYVISRNETKARIVDLQDEVEDKMCPYPPYKQISYKFRGENINNLQRLMFNEFDMELDCEYEEENFGKNEENAECYDDKGKNSNYIYKDREFDKNKKYRTIITKFGIRIDEDTEEEYYFKKAAEKDEILFRQKMMIQKKLSKIGKAPSIRTVYIKKNKEGIAIVEVPDQDQHEDEDEED